MADNKGQVLCNRQGPGNDYRGVKNKTLLFWGILVLAFCGLMLPDVGAVEQKEKNKETINGDWVGKLVFGGKEFRILFQLQQSPGGRISGIFKSLDQEPAPLPMTDVRLKGRDIFIQIKEVGSYRGKVSLKSGRMSGDWMGEDGNELALDLRRSKEKWSYKRPQTPKAPFVHEVREVEIANKLGKNSLSGTLSLPKGRGPFPAAVLVSDFGAQDRDGTIHDHKPLAVMAEYLAKKGIATLRYDDRGVGKSTGTYEFATTMDLATDAAAAFEFLKKQQEIDAANVGIIGHGEGGLIGPIVTSKREGMAFLVLLAAPGVRGDQLLLTQNEAVGRAAGLSDEMLDLIRRLMSSVFQLLIQPTPDLAKAEKLGVEFEDRIKELPPEEGEKLMKFGGMLEGQFELVKTQSPWFSWIVSYDPGPVLQQVKCPVLLLNGEKDLQVLAGINLPTIKRHLVAGGNERVESKKLSGLNHLFQKADKGLPGEYAMIEQTFSTSALMQIAEWITKTTGR